MRKPVAKAASHLALTVVLSLASLGACVSRSGGGARTRNPQSSALKVVVPPADKDAELWIDGNYIGQLAEFDDAQVGLPLLAPGVHRVEVRKPGRFPVQRSVEVPGDAPPETVLEAELLEDPR